MKTAAFLAACLALIASPAARGDSHGLIRITRSGITHTLSQNHAGTIVIDASHVTLDCNHHRVYLKPGRMKSLRPAAAAAVRVGATGRVQRTHVTVRNCIVQAGDGQYRYGILAENASHVTLVNNVVAGRGYVHAVKLAGAGAFTLDGNVFRGSTRPQGGVVSVAGDNVSITNNTVELSAARGARAAIAATGASVAIIDNTLTGCNAVDSVGIEVRNAGGGAILGNTITDFVVPLEVDETAGGIEVSGNLII